MLILNILLRKLNNWERKCIFKLVKSTTIGSTATLDPGIEYLFWLWFCWCF